MKVGISISKYSKVKNALASNSTSFIVWSKKDIIVWLNTILEVQNISKFFTPQAFLGTYFPSSKLLEKVLYQYRIIGFGLTDNARASFFPPSWSENSPPDLFKNKNPTEAPDYRVGRDSLNRLLSPIFLEAWSN